MSETPVEVSGNAADDLNTALVAFTGCIGEALEELCSYGLTYGDAYVPFLPDEDDTTCDEDEVLCSQAWVRVTDVSPSPGGIEAWGGDCAVELTVGLEVGILRCVDIPEGGEAPTMTGVLTAAMQANTDMQAILCAAMGCEVWGSLDVGQWQPTGPLGGQYGGIWTFSVTL